MCRFVGDSVADVCRHYCIEHKGYHECAMCDNKLFVTKRRYYDHFEKDHLNEGSKCQKYKDYQCHLQRHYIRRAEFKPHVEKSIEMVMFVTQKQEIKKELDDMYSRYKHIKVCFVLHGVFAKIDMHGNELSNDVLMITSSHYRLYTAYDREHYIDFLISASDRLCENLDAIETTGSGFILKYIKAMDIKFIMPSLIGGCLDDEKAYQNYISQYSAWRLVDSNLLDFAPSQEQFCFLYAVAAAMILRKDPSSNKKLDALNLLVKENVKQNFLSDKKLMKKFSFPFHIKDCKRFEDYCIKKGLLLAFNVWSVNGDKLWVMYQSKQNEKMPRVDILLMQPEKDDSVFGHYVAIPSVPKFIRAVKVHIQKQRKSTKELEYCKICNYSFASPKLLKKHLAFCQNAHQQVLQMPSHQEKFYKFDSYEKQAKAPYICFADFEAKMKFPTDAENGTVYNCDNCARGGPMRHCSHSERVIAEQIPMTFTFLCFTSEGKLIFKRTFSSDEGVMNEFFRTLDVLEEKLKGELNPHKTLKMSSRQRKAIDRANVCWICKSEFMFGDNNHEYSKVVDHCHATPPKFNTETKCYESKILGAAHKKCNRERHNPKSIPIYIHNLMSYDSNFLLNHMDQNGKYMRKYARKLKGLAKNTNKFRTITIGQWKFLDSYQMLSGSLSDLVNQYTHDKKVLFLLRQVFKNITNQQQALLLKKAAFPYEWVQSVKQLEDTKCFPSYEHFFSRLSNSIIDREHYNDGLNVFTELKCENMLKYTELYCELDTVLLAEVVFEFRTQIFDKFNLSIEHYISLPQLAFDSCLKYIDRPLERILDKTMLTMFEQNIRGGVSFVNNRYTKIDPKKNESIMYIDANNLYGFAQKMCLPISHFQWVPKKLFSSIDWMKQTADQKTGYVAEVDLDFPPELHDIMDDLPLAPEHVEVDYDKLSQYSKTVKENLQGLRRAKSSKSKKLITSVESKTRYVVHYLNLQFYLQLGAKITKIHSVVKFKQEDFLKPFIDFCSAQRAAAKTKFEQNLWKLILNSLYGKFIQNVRLYLKTKFVDSSDHLGRLLRNPLFMDISQLSQNVCVVWQRNQIIKLDKFYSIGFSILELSKLYMYKIWYNVIKPNFGSNAELILTDTDSFVIKFKNNSKHEVLTKLKPIMDTSNFPPATHFWSIANQRIPGFFKDEYPTGIITEAVAVRSKCYFLKIEPDPAYENESEKSSIEHIVCKGMPSNISKDFPIDLYKACIFSENTNVKSTMHRIQAKKRKLHTVAVTKQAMASGDDKRYQLCNVHSAPYGSKYAKMSYCYKCEKEK